MSRLARMAAGFDKQAKSGIYTHGIAETAQDPRVGGNMTMSYPRKGFSAADPRDEIMRVKAELIKEGKVSGMTPFGMVTVTDADLRWLEQKRDVEAKAEFDEWIGTNFHTNDVVTRAWLQEIYPEYYDVREQEMISRAGFALRVHLLQMRGPRNHKDLVLYWALQQGLVELDRDWDRIGAGKVTIDKKEENRRFRNALMNPWKYKSDEEREHNYKSNNNPFAPSGSEIRQKKADQGGIPGGFGLGVEPTKRYPTFLNQVLSPSLYGSANARPAGPVAAAVAGQ